MPAKLVLNHAAALADVIHRMIVRPFDLEVLQAVVALVAVPVMNVRALRKRDACLVENEAMLENVAVAIRDRMPRCPYPHIAIRPDVSFLAVASALRATRTVSPLLRTALAKVVMGAITACIATAPIRRRRGSIGRPLLRQGLRVSLRRASHNACAHCSPSGKD